MNGEFPKFMSVKQVGIFSGIPVAMLSERNGPRAKFLVQHRHNPWKTDRFALVQTQLFMVRGDTMDNSSGFGGYVLKKSRALVWSIFLQCLNVRCTTKPSPLA